MRTLEIFEIDVVAGGTRKSIGAHPLSASIHHAKAHKKVHHAKAKIATLKSTSLTHTVTPADDGDGDGRPISEGGGGGGDGDGDGGDGDGDGGDGDGAGGDGDGAVNVGGGDGGYESSDQGYDGDGTAANPQVAVGYREVDVGGTQTYDVWVANANGGNEFVFNSTGQTLEQTLPGECSIGSLTSAIVTGAVGGAVLGGSAGIETGPGAIITGLAGAILGAGVGATGQAIGCAVAIYRADGGGK